MSVGLETKQELTLFQALRSASAEQLRRALKMELRRQQQTVDPEDAPYSVPDLGPIDDEDALEEARFRWRRGDKREALHHLELALGRDFSGLGDLQPEHLK